MSRRARAALLALALTALAGCTLPGSRQDPAWILMPATEVAGTPFFPQEAYQCGPAALATVLMHSGVTTGPEQLVDQVYIPEREGSLQVEMLAATRRHGRLAYLVDPSLNAIHAQLDAGRPVLVLQNLGWGWLPIWHYAVVIGMEPGRDQVILRSGTHRRHVMSTSEFLASWQKATHWGFVVLRPGQLPARPDPNRLVTSIRAMQNMKALEILPAWRALQAHWPDFAPGWIGAAEALYQAGDHIAAEQELRSFLKRQPDHSVALNNLAMLLSERGCGDAARKIIDRGLEGARPGLREAILETRREIHAKPKGSCR